MAPAPRFLSLADVAEVLNTSQAQVYALVRRGDLPAIRIGGRNQWRVESDQLEAYIARMYDETRSYVDTHPFAEGPNAPEVAVDGTAGAEGAAAAAEGSADL